MTLWSCALLSKGVGKNQTRSRPWTAGMVDGSIWVLWTKKPQNCRPKDHQTSGWHGPVWDRSWDLSFWMHHLMFKRLMFIVQASYVYLLWPFFTPQTLEAMKSHGLRDEMWKMVLLCSRFCMWFSGFPFLRCSFCWYLTFLGTPRSDKKWFFLPVPKREKHEKKNDEIHPRSEGFSRCPAFFTLVGIPTFSNLKPVRVSKLVGGLEHVLFSPIVGMMIQSD